MFHVFKFIKCCRLSGAGIAPDPIYAMTLKISGLHCIVGTVGKMQKPVFYYIKRSHSGKNFLIFSDFIPVDYQIFRIFIIVEIVS